MDFNSKTQSNFGNLFVFRGNNHFIDMHASRTAFNRSFQQALTPHLEQILSRQALRPTTGRY